MKRPFFSSARGFPRLFFAAAFAALLPVASASCGGKVEVATGPAFDPCYDLKTEEDCGGDCHWEWGVKEGTCGQPEALGCFGPASQCMSDSDCRVEQTCQELEIAPCPPGALACPATCAFCRSFCWPPAPGVP